MGNKLSAEALSNINYTTVSEEFIRKYKNQLDWDKISKNEKLSTEFMHKFVNKLNGMSLVIASISRMTSLLSL